MSFLVLNQLKKAFGTALAVDNFELEVAKGELVTFLGPSGCGKSTTLRIIAGFETCDGGQIWMNQQEITHLPANRRKIGMVFQSYALFPNMTVAENIGFGLKLAKEKPPIIKKRVNEMLSLIRLEVLAQRYPHQISGGQAQRVALARALAPQPQLLLLDEPLSALDALIRRSLRAEIRQIQQQLGITTIFVTHDQEEALSLSDRIVVMNQGRIEQIGTPFEIYNYPTTNFVASFIGTLNMLPARVTNAAKGEINLGGHTVRVAGPLSQSDNTEITLALRPENLKIVEVEEEGLSATENFVHAKVKEVSLLGAVVRVRLSLAEVLLELDMFNSRHLTLPVPGAEVKLSFPIDSGLILTKPNTTIP
ncbi:MAG: ABC transporter ATP-binding protein [Chloroflexota bacterium]|nr:ABC transporter ATP-binding protein [Chloroflexota bacterium]